MDHTNRFDGKGEIYAKARPKYAEALLDYLMQTCAIATGSVIADVGSGTGILTEQLLQAGYRVFAVEPNGDMRRKAEEKLSRNENFLSVDGRDSDMKLPDRSVDAVTASQAFHWFDAEAFRKECRRVLRPAGRVILVYNSRDESADCTRALAALRHFLWGDPKRLFSVRLDEASLARLGEASEAYLMTRLERGFRTLDFWKSLQPFAGR